MVQKKFIRLSVRTIILLLFLCCVQITSATDEKYFWKHVRSEVKKNPEKVKVLVDRLARMDTTLTVEESILAFYGQSYLLKNKEDELADRMIKLFSNNSLEAAFDTAFLVLSINPLHIRALIISALVLYQLDSTFSYNTQGEDIDYFFKRAFSLLHVIAQTGDGSISKPYYVTKITEEYDFVNYYLGIRNIRSQSVNMDIPCDVLEIGVDNSENTRQVHFEITRVLEFEKKLLGY